MKYPITSEQFSVLYKAVRLLEELKNVEVPEEQQEKLNEGYKSLSVLVSDIVLFNIKESIQSDKGKE